MSITVKQLTEWLDRQMDNGIVSPNAIVVLNKGNDAYGDPEEEDLEFNFISVQRKVDFATDGNIIGSNSYNEERLVILAEQ